MDVGNVDRMIDVFGVIKCVVLIQVVLINDIFDLFCIILGMMKFSIYLFNIVGLIFEVVKFFEVGFVSKNIQLLINCEDDYM